MLSYDMNEYQKSIMNIEKAYPNTSVCCVGGVINLEDIDIPLAERAALFVIRQNPALRMQIDRSEKLYINDDVQTAEMREYRDVRDKDEIINEIMSEPFELYDSPLYRFICVKTPLSVFGLLKIHHILGDHIALLEIFRELEKNYIALKNGTEPDVKPDMRYIETMLGNIGGDFTDAKKHFRRRFEKYGVHTPKHRMKSLGAGIYKYNADTGAALQIIDFCRKNKIKPESVFYAALAIYERRTRGADNITIGRVLMNRGRGQLDAVGLYANTVPVFIRSEGDFLTVCRRAEDELSESIRYSSYPLNCILRDNNIHERCFDAEISFISMGMIPAFKIAEPKKYFNGCVELPMRIHILRRKRSLEINIEYSDEIYSGKYICAFTQSLINIIIGGINGREPEALTDADKAAYAELNSVTEFEANTTVSRLFSEYAAAHGDETAVIYNGEKYTFDEINRTANGIAKLCAGKKLVGIAMGRCKYLVPAMIGVMRAGAAYMPLNPRLDIPTECDMVLSLSEYGKDGAILPDKLNPNVDYAEDLSSPDAAAYYMRTSGSEGEAKTVMISNGSLYLRLKWMHDMYSLKRNILQKTTPTFDVSGWELLCGAFGGCSVMMRDGEEKNPELIAEYINEYKIEAIHFVPSMLRLFLRYIDRDPFPTLRNVFSSGEALDAAAVRLFYEKLPNAEMSNLYGPTECTIDVTGYDCTGRESEIPIGKPVYNTRIYIVCPNGSLAPRGVEGEIVVTGGLVGLGYSGGGGGYTELNGCRAYRTGDRGLLGFDGNIYYRGRRDSLVKINGKRADLGEIERLAFDIDGVTGCAAAAGENTVTLFYEAKKPINDISARLAKKTDRLPSRIIYLEKLPLLSSGKVNRAALLKTEMKTQIIPPENETESVILREALAELSSDPVKVKIGVEDNLMDYGLDSLSVLSFMLRLRGRGFDFKVQDIYANPTVRMLAKRENKPRMLVRLNDIESDWVLCCFPYAGGAPQAFSKIAAETEYSAVGVNYDFFESAANISEIAEAVTAELKQYKKIKLVSSCVGSAYALAAATALEKEGVKVEKIYIAASLPDKTPGGINPWRLLSAKSVMSVLSENTGRQLPKNLTSEAFLRDTDRYFKYMAKEKPRVTAPACIAFADDDAFTKGYKRKTERWRKYLTGDITFSVFKTDNHYFMSDTDGILGRMEEGEGFERYS